MNAFAMAHPWMTFWLWLILGLWTLDTIRIVTNRTLRHRNVALRGWPPAHLDVDGDWKPESKPDED